MHRLRTFGAFVVAAVTAGLVWTGVAVAAPGPCADTMPTAAVLPGDDGEGWTVVSGTDPQSFDAEVLGVMPDLIAPGRDVILVEISGPTVDAGGGVWAGMSGSPVYIDHGGGPQLAGALAYGFSFGATNIAGLTPADDILAVNDLAVSPRIPARLKLPRSMVRKVAHTIGAALPTVGGSLVRLKVPLAISGGVSADRLKQMRKLPFFKKYKASLMLTPGSSSSGSLSGVVDDLVPGGNFAAALSYGALTSAGVGTTTYVCDGQALAFGHPMLFTGKSHLGAGSADAMAIVPDPLGPYKLANVSSPVGILDQDRLAGIRAVDGQPASVPIHTVVTSLDSAHPVEDGQTDVVFTEAYPDIAFSHIFSSIDSVFDQIGPGSASYEWTIEGEREDGTPWEFSKTNMYVSQFDLSFESAFELYGELLAIASYPNEKVEITNTEATINVDEDVSDLRLEKLLWCHGGSCESVRRIRSHPGATLRFKAILKPSDGSARQRETFDVHIPAAAHGGAAVTVRGGSGCDPFFGTGCDFKTPATFDDLLASFDGQPNNVLVAQLLTGRRGKLSDEVTSSKDEVISGSKHITIVFPGECCPPPVESFEDSGGGFFFFRHA
jgi:hypothetical protein